MFRVGSPRQIKGYHHQQRTSQIKMKSPAEFLEKREGEEWQQVTIASLSPSKHKEGRGGDDRRSSREDVGVYDSLKNVDVRRMRLPSISKGMEGQYDDCGKDDVYGQYVSVSQVYNLGYKESSRGLREGSTEDGTMRSIGYSTSSLERTNAFREESPSASSVAGDVRGMRDLSPQSMTFRDSNRNLRDYSPSSLSWLDESQGHSRRSLQYSPVYRTERKLSESSRDQSPVLGGQNLVRFDANLQPLPHIQDSSNELAARFSPLGKSGVLDYKEEADMNWNNYINLHFDEPEWANMKPEFGKQQHNILLIKRDLI